MRLRTLGGLSLEGSDFRRGKSLLLLAYLAVEGPQERRHLADLFWPGSAQGLRNLATVLTRLRKAGDSVIDADGARAWTTVDCDATGLLALLENGKYLQAFELYEGPFMVGETPNWGSELEEWVYQTRELLAGHVREALLSLAETEAADGDFKGGARRADNAYLLTSAPPVEPEDLERLHRLMVAGGSLHAGKVRKEALGFGLSLGVSTSEARGQLGHEKQRDISFLPVHGTPFVGREAELPEVTQLLAQPECRLLTMTGVGGVGKTRLAQEVVRGLLGLELFNDGVFFVPLEALYLRRVDF